LDDKLQLPLDFKGITKRRREFLIKLGLKTNFDVLQFFPRDYEDWTDLKTITQVPDNEIVTFIGKISSLPSLRRKGKMTILTASITDKSGFTIKGTWFNQPYFQEKLKLGESFYFRGKIKSSGFLREIVNPVFEIISEEDSVGIKPVYRLTAGLSQGIIRNLVKNAIEECIDEIYDPLPFETRKKYNLSTVRYAYEKIHRPKDALEFDIARRRLAFEELFLIQAGLKLVKNTIANKKSAKKIHWSFELLEEFTRTLPFQLTPSQERVISEILKDLNMDVPMNRIVQGDVGSGKTVVSAAAIYCCIKTGMQAALMAPTSVLANQHYNTFTSFFKKFDFKIRLLTGSVTAKNKKIIYEDLKKGNIDFIIGTHAVLEEKVEFKNLGLAVTDEQHRFGVKQRSILASGSRLVPHVLVMSATPIPRTLGFVLYGDLDISVIKGLPSGRVPVETYTAKSSDDERIYNLVRREITQGRQAYIVCPLIEATAESDLNSVKELYENLSENVFPDIKVGLMHGSLKTFEKESVMKMFMENTINILVSTTVIEVGVDNPQASIMIIENSERFGLAQLHQLRGRIGRGRHRSICILKSDSKQENSTKRLKIMCKTSDGFEIAEQDLLQRGIGDFFGTRQHGIPELKIANLYTDTEILKEAKKAVEEIFISDPFLEAPENRNIIPMLKILFGSLYENIGI